MQSLWHNKYVRFGLFGFGAILALLVLLAAWQFFGSATGLSSHSADYGGYGAPQAFETEGIALDRGYISEDSFAILPARVSDGEFISNLEAYETTAYIVNARTSQFADFCTTLTDLKADDRFDFRHLSQYRNSCDATFYTEEQYAPEALEKLKAFSGVTVTRTTHSVTRQREQLASRTDILRQQLVSIERTLADAERDFETVAEVARSSNDATELSVAIREKLRIVNDLTQQKINLSAQINNALRQAQDLDERIGLVQFSISAEPVIRTSLNETENEWKQAWHDLKERFTDTLIGLSAFLGIFLLYTLQAVAYLLIVIVIIRLLWKFVRLVWRKL